MKVVGLLSGGKDSVYNLIHCVKQGHEPVAVASLGPPEGKDELDSYMYQTVGHSGLKVLAQALDLPFFVRTISGTAVNQRGEYGSRKGKAKEVVNAGAERGDETEDLYELLRAVKEAMPEVQGVSVGAILSNYQRVRVEHVCARLGLTPLAYLWERSQPDLLAEMIVAGMESVLVKVAGAGLQVKHLGQTLAQMQPTLHKLNEMYDLHVCGEGGEYETFTVDCPLFKRRVHLDKTTTVVSDSSPFSTVAHLHLDSVSLSSDPKPDVPEHESWIELQARIQSTVDVGVPPLLDQESQEWEKAARKAYDTCVVDDSVAPSASSATSHDPAPKSYVMASQARSAPGGWLYVSEVVAPPAARHAEIEQEVQACFEQLEAILVANNASLLDLAHLTVYLSPSAETMALFPRINAIYASFFGTSPPTRACVAVPGPSEPGAWRVKLEGVARVSPDTTTNSGSDSERRALHIQSMSYWAPANIGPYSQSVNTGGRIHIAGQIPLVPASLSLPPGPSDPVDNNDPRSAFSFHAALALQHLVRIVACSSPSESARPESAIAWLAPCPSETTWRRRVAACHAAWTSFTPAGESIPFLAVEAAALPRDAAVEWQATWSSPVVVVAADSDSEDEAAKGQNHLTEQPDESIRICGIRIEDMHSFDDVVNVTANAANLKVFYRPQAISAEQVATLFRTTNGKENATDFPRPAISLIPANRLATSSHGNEQFDVVVVGGPAA
ncbi:hypothetical protein JCM10908_002334 [Rhodotorula pacifica]|uniref:diphthine--ammonia ligase n=1 Tax=Rhodotorula pacifica TaxID=1495444 RepID=UPI00316D0085